MQHAHTHQNTLTRTNAIGALNACVLDVCEIVIKTFISVLGTHLLDRLIVCVLVSMSFARWFFVSNVFCLRIKFVSVKLLLLDIMTNVGLFFAGIFCLFGLFCVALCRRKVTLVCGNYTGLNVFVALDWFGQNRICKNVLCDRESKRQTTYEWLNCLEYIDIHVRVWISLLSWWVSLCWIFASERWLQIEQSQNQMGGELLK